MYIILLAQINNIYNSKCRLYGDRDETINHIMSEYCKLAQKEYKTRHDWELYKKLKFDHMNK